MSNHKMSRGHHRPRSRSIGVGSFGELAMKAMGARARFGRMKRLDPTSGGILLKMPTPNEPLPKAA